MEPKKSIFTHSNRLSTAQTECGEIARSTRTAAANAHKDGLTTQLLYELSVLKEQIEKMRSQRQDFAMARTDSLGPSDKTIQEEFDLIQTHIRNACSWVDVTTNISANIQNMGQDNQAIESWTRRIARCSFSHLVSSALEGGISELEVIKSLAAVGVCDLVFESSFPHFIAAESPLLDQYRKHVLTRGTNTLTS
jgi:hypothetical protein